jgi:hypothetical protein
VADTVCRACGIMFERGASSAEVEPCVCGACFSGFFWLMVLTGGRSGCLRTSHGSRRMQTASLDQKTCVRLVFISPTHPKTLHFPSSRLSSLPSLCSPTLTQLRILRSNPSMPASRFCSDEILTGQSAKPDAQPKIPCATRSPLHPPLPTLRLQPHLFRHPHQHPANLRH